MAVQATNLQFDYSKYGFRDAENYVYKSGQGLNEKVARELSGMKGEPEWMLRRRLQALEIFNQKPVPLKGMWANEELAELDYDKIHYFVRAGEKPQTDWDAVPAEIKNTFEKLGIPEAERKFLAGVGAQYESEVVYHSLARGVAEAWRDLPGHRLSAQGVPRDLQEVLRDDHPLGRQQVRRAEYGGLVGWLVCVRAQGRACRYPAAGLLPDQRREHGPVRAHADHRRGRRLGALYRRLHRAGLL